MIPELRSFLDERGRVTALPVKHKRRLMAVWYLAGKLEPGRDYTQEELGDSLDAWHTFHDPAFFRRSMVELGLMTRERDGSRYTLLPDLPALEEFLGRNM